MATSEAGSVSTSAGGSSHGRDAGDDRLESLEEFRSRAEGWMKEVTAQVARLAGSFEHEEKKRSSLEKRLADIEDRIRSLLTLTELVSLDKNPFAASGAAASTPSAKESTLASSASAADASGPSAPQSGSAASIAPAQAAPRSKSQARPADAPGPASSFDADMGRVDGPGEQTQETEIDTATHGPGPGGEVPRVADDGVVSDGPSPPQEVEERSMSQVLPQAEDHHQDHERLASEAAAPQHDGAPEPKALDEPELPAGHEDAGPSLPSAPAREGEASVQGLDADLLEAAGEPVGEVSEAEHDAAPDLGSGVREAAPARPDETALARGATPQPVYSGQGALAAEGDESPAATPAHAEPEAAGEESPASAATGWSVPAPERASPRRQTAFHPNDARAEHEPPAEAKDHGRDEEDADDESAPSPTQAAEQRERRLLVVDWANLLTPHAKNVDVNEFTEFYVDAEWVDAFSARLVSRLVKQMAPDVKQARRSDVRALHQQTVKLLTEHDPSLTRFNRVQEGRGEPLREEESQDHGAASVEGHVDAR